MIYWETEEPTDKKGKTMFELLTVIFFAWLFIKAVGIAFRLTWGITKIVAGILIVAALPVLLICLLFASGIVLLLPIALIGAAVGLGKAFVNA